MLKIIKLGLISLVFFALLITGISLFFPSNVRISKAIDINTTREKLLEQLSDTSQWKNWYPGADSADVLPQIISRSDSSISANSTMRDGRKGITGWNIYDSGIPNTLTLQWYMDFKLRWYPWEKFSGLLFEKRYGPMMERGLEQLKNYLNK